MKLLAIDTATEACSAALFMDGEIVEQYQIAPREHTRLILPMVEAVLGSAGCSLQDCDALAFGQGPGAFTGLRVAAGVIQGLALGADLPVVGISSLAALAQGVYRVQGEQAILAGIDARMAEVYWGCYQLDENQLMCLQGTEQVCAPASVPELLSNDQDWFGVGTAWETYGAELSQHLGVLDSRYQGLIYPRAQDIATLAVAAYQQGQAVSAELAIPVYLRDQVAKKRAEQG